MQAIFLLESDVLRHGRIPVAADAAAQDTRIGSLSDDVCCGGDGPHQTL
jgi:hypothetical protein